MGRISDEDVQRVRDATDVVALISESIVLKQKGRLYWGLCPFHGEKTPSFKADPTTQLWHCFGCGAGGDAIGFLMRQEHYDFPDAVRALADRARIEIHEVGDSTPRGHKDRLVEACEAAAEFYHKTLVSGREPGAQTARAYLAKRGFGIEVAKEFGLGFAPGRGALSRHLKESGFSAEEIVEANLGLRTDRGDVRDRFFDRVMFPIKDLRGRTIAFGGRVLGDGEPKYLNTSETAVFQKSRNLYALDRAKNEIVKSGTVVVVEGYTDVIALHVAGVRDAVATLGTALTREHVKLLGRFAKRIVYLFDADEAGLRAAERAAEFIDVSVEGTAGRDPIELAVAVVPEGKDPADYVASHGAEGVRKVIESAEPLLRFVLDRRLEKHDLDRPEGRSRALAAAASVLASVKGTLLAQDYSNYVADRLLVDFSTVAEAVRHAQPSLTREPDSAEQESPQGPRRIERAALRDPRLAAAREYVSLVVADATLRPQARELLDNDVLGDQELRTLLKLTVEAGAATGRDLYNAVAAVDPDAAELLSGLVVGGEDEQETGDLAKELLSKLKEFALERQIIEKKTRLKRLDTASDRVEFDELFKEIAVLQKRVDKLRRGAGKDE